MDLNLLGMRPSEYGHDLSKYLQDHVTDRYTGMTVEEVTEDIIQRHEHYFQAISEMTGVSGDDLKDIYRNGSAEENFYVRLNGLLTKTSHEIIIVSDAPSNFRDSSFGIKLAEQAVHFGFKNHDLDVNSITNNNHLANNILLVDPQATNLARKIDVRNFEKLKQGLGKAFPVILHDILHGVMPGDGKNYPEYEKSLHLHDALGGQYETLVQGFHSLLINEAPSLRPQKLRMIEGLIEMHEAVHDLSLIATTQLGYGQKEIKSMRDYFNGMIGWIAWHTYRPEDPDYAALRNIMATEEQSTGYLLPRRAEEKNKLDLQRLISDGGQAIEDASDKPVIICPDGAMRTQDGAMKYMRENPVAVKAMLTEGMQNLVANAKYLLERKCSRDRSQPFTLESLSPELSAAPS